MPSFCLDFTVTLNLFHLFRWRLSHFKDTFAKDSPGVWVISLGQMMHLVCLLGIKILKGRFLKIYDKAWKHFRCPPLGGWLNKLWYSHNGGQCIYKKEWEIFLYTTILLQSDLQNISLSQKEKKASRCRKVCIVGHHLSKNQRIKHYKIKTKKN